MINLLRCRDRSRCLAGLASFLIGFAPIAQFCQARPLALEVTPIEQFHLLDADRVQFGKLDFVGGLELSSDDEDFGGLSGFGWIYDQAFMAITDRGMVVSGVLETSQGKPSGISLADIHSLPGLGPDVARWKKDSEGLDITGNKAFVSFEGAHRVETYGLEGRRLSRSFAKVRLDRSILKVNRGNKGLEAVAIAPSASPYNGAMILVSERVVDQHAQGWIVQSGKSRAFRFAQKSDFLVTDAAFTHEGDLIVLERDFSLFGGLHIHLRRIRAEDFQPGLIGKSETLFEGNLQHELDNMEGLAIQRLENGDSLLTLVSDDNFNPLQRTLLLQFLLKRDSEMGAVR